MTSHLKPLHIAFTLASVVAPGLAFAAEDTTCRERVYLSERARGETHKDAIDNAKDACPAS